MTNSESLSYRAPIEQYEALAELLLRELQSGNNEAAWRFKWGHPRFRGRPVTDVPETLTLDDARLVVAREFSFESWADVAAFSEMVLHDRSVSDFEAAVEAVVSGELTTLRAMLTENPDLVRARSARRHHATLLHYIAANGVEQERQITPPNAVEVARVLLEAGADVNALADMYDQKCTTMGLLVSSCHPAEAGLQGELAETLVDYGAAIVGPDSRGQSDILTALAFGYSDTARRLAERAPPSDDLVIAAGLGKLADASRLLPAADGKARHVALALAAQHGHTDVVQLLLDAGEDPNRFNPEGFHPHSTPLHQAVLANHLDVTSLLIERGARLDVRDTVYQATPLGWAMHGERTLIVDYLRSKGATT